MASKRLGLRSSHFIGGGRGVGESPCQSARRTRAVLSDRGRGSSEAHVCRSCQPTRTGAGIADNGEGTRMQLVIGDGMVASEVNT